MPTTKLKNTLYRAALPFCAPSCGPSPVTEAQGHPLTSQRSFVRLIRRHHVLGSVTLLESDGSAAVICTSSAEPAHTARPQTYFRVASVTKLATSVLVMRLVDEGVLSLDAPVSSCLPDSGVLDGITLRHLLSHTSGLADPPGLEESVENGVPFTEIVPSARVRAPGSGFRYSNLGFGLIGCVLESVLGEPVGTVFSERLFIPVGMNATLEGCTLPKERIMPVTRILPWHRGMDLVLTRLGSVPLMHPDPLRHYGHTAGSMYTDASSLQKLLHVLIRDDASFLSGSARSEMIREHASYGALSPSLSYGLGVLRILDPAISGSLVYGHQGFAYGCADGAFWEADTGRIMITLNGGCSEARSGRLGLANRDFLRWAFRKELPSW